MKLIYFTVLIIGIAVGVCLYSTSLRYSWYTVTDKDIAQFSRSLENKPRNVRWQEWYQGLRNLETPRKILRDAGVGIMTFTLMLVVLYFMSGFPLRQARTPKRKRYFMLLFLTALAVQMPCSIVYYMHRQIRFEYPVWGDSIGIGVFQTGFNCIIFGGIGVLLFISIMYISLFPANIYIWSKDHPVLSSLVTVFFVVPVLFFLYTIYYSIRTGDYGEIIMIVTLIYLLSSARAGIINYELKRFQRLGKRLQEEKATS
jgi:hypothetical protein